MLLPSRQNNGEGASGIDGAAHTYLTAVRLDDVPGDGQSQSDASVWTRQRIVDLIKRQENLFVRFRRDADPGILYSHQHPRWFIDHCDGDAPRRRSKLHS